MLIVWRYRRAAAIPFRGRGDVVLDPAVRTFQTGYLTLIVVLASAGWLLIDGVASDEGPDPTNPATAQTGWVLPTEASCRRRIGDD